MEAIGRLAAGVVHDFNNLLLVVMAGLDLLERSADSSRRARVMSEMRQAATRGEALARQLLTFSRGIKLSPQPTDLRRLLDGMSLLLGAALRGDTVVHMRIPDDLWLVMADPTELELAILNMVTNARDAMPGGGTLTIDLTNARLDRAGGGGLVGEFVRIEVRDTGVGIPPEILDHLFEPFFTTKDADKGTGLGLSQVHAFAEQSRGHIAVTSRLGQGTSIILHLPRASAAEGSDKGGQHGRQSRMW